MWRRSADQMEPAPILGGPPGPLPPAPTVPDPGQRRFNFLVIGLMLVLVCALIAGLVVYNHQQAVREAATESESEVLKAFFGYYAGFQAAYKALDPSFLRDYVTPDQLALEEGGINHARTLGYRFSETASHDTRVVVYSNGNLASVDDIITRHTTPLDLTTLNPAGDETTDTVHQSFGLSRIGQRWLVSSARTFGTGTPEAGHVVSYAAKPGSPVLSHTYLAQINDAYQRFWDIRSAALTTLDGSRLSVIEVGQELTTEAATLRADRSKGEGFRSSVQHNIRLAEQNDSTVWVYDTYLLQGWEFEFSSGKTGKHYTELTRQAFRFVRTGTGWKADYDIREL